MQIAATVLPPAQDLAAIPAKLHQESEMLFEDELEDTKMQADLGLALRALLAWQLFMNSKNLKVSLSPQRSLRSRSSCPRLT